MRYVYLDASKVPADWLAKANDLTSKIKAETNAAKRKALIDANAAHWGKLKPELLAMSHQKCWYMEADDSVSDWHVDHFRPKANYQWLAFEWTNYRIAGAKPNRKKSDYFPLEDPKTAASFGAQSTATEEIILLDPTIPGDSDLIAFDEQGKVKPAKPSDPQAVKRVEASRDRFDMDTERLISKRLGVWNLCQKKLDQIRPFLRSCERASRRG